MVVHRIVLFHSENLLQNMEAIISYGKKYLSLKKTIIIQVHKKKLVTGTCRSAG